nr:hypothetical protein BaRGS_019330 [Batillaria attramentaria]
MLLSVPGKVLNRVLLERMSEAVDPMLRDQQAGFRRNRSCADQIASLRIIVEQSLEWNSPLNINFIDCFDSVDREALWKLLRHYGVPRKIISLIQCTYQDMSCKIAHAGQLSESFEVKTGVRQGCLLSPFLFLLVIDWIIKTTTTSRNKMATSPACVMETTDREPSSDVTSLTSSDTSERHVAEQRLQRGRELLERGRQGKKNEKQTTLAGFLPRRHRSKTPSKRLRSDSQSPPMRHEKTARTFAAEKSLNSGQASSSTAEGSGT